MLNIMNYITDKPDWRTKVRDIFPFSDLAKFIRSIDFFGRDCKQLEAGSIGISTERYLRSNDGLGH